MTHNKLVNTENGTDKTLEEALGVSSVVNGNTPPSFAPTAERGGIAIHPGSLPSHPTTGTIALDINDNTLKWWNGNYWVAAGS